jgi:hypothetical protein
MMKVLFLSIEDLDTAKYFRKENKNLLKTDFGMGDTIALCGELINAERTDYGPRFWIKDNGKKIGVVVGTFNKEVRKDAEKILEQFKVVKEEKKESKIYLLLYGNPYYRDKLYINVNQDNGVILVSKKTYEKFHELREKSRVYLVKKSKRKLRVSHSKKEEGEIEKEKEKFSWVEILRFLKKKRSGEAKIEDIEKEFSNEDKNLVEKKILELLESGKAYEPKAGLIKLI